MSIDTLGFPDVGGMNVEGMDPKTALNQYCQRYCSRPVTKSDIMYMHTKFDFNQFQAIVKLNCMAGQEYAGELCPSAKEAEKSAAHQALQAYRTVALPAPQPRNQKKKKASGPVVDPETGEVIEGEASEDIDNPALTHKVRLNAACMRIVKRALQKGETIYICRPLSLGKVRDGFIATVQLACLPGAWAEKTFQGEACSNKQDAAQSAAEVALADIMADPELGALASKAASSSKGKGRGKGSKGKGWGNWGKGWQDGPGLPRERIAEGVSGEVVEWKGTFGWIKPSQEPDHPAAARRGGKVYVHQQDLSGEASELQAGAQVRFLLYCDPSGLGAEQVTLA